MAIGKVSSKLRKKCFSCSYEWVSRIEVPQACPRCKQRNYSKIKPGTDLFDV